MFVSIWAKFGSVAREGAAHRMTATASLVPTETKGNLAATAVDRINLGTISLNCTDSDAANAT